MEMISFLVLRGFEIGKDCSLVFESPGASLFLSIEGVPFISKSENSAPAAFSSLEEVENMPI